MNSRAHMDPGPGQGVCGAVDSVSSKPSLKSDPDKCHGVAGVDPLHLRKTSCQILVFFGHPCTKKKSEDFDPVSKSFTTGFKPGEGMGGGLLTEESRAATLT